MAFNATAAGAAAANYLGDATLVSPLGPTTAYDANNNMTVSNASGSRIAGGGAAVGPNGMIHSLTVAMSAGGTVLAAYNANGITGVATDTGVLVTAAAVANSHSLPVNFGPGQGNWAAIDYSRLNVTTQVATADYSPATNYNSPVLTGIPVIAAGNLTIAFKNMSAEVIGVMFIHLHWRHSATL